jgi:hypothetical protein
VTPPELIAVHSLQTSCAKPNASAEYDKMPVLGGRTLAERTRKAELEARLGEITWEVSSVRLALKTSGFR